MPIYEYRCAKCGEKFEAFQKITDLPLTECKFCGGKVEQLISCSSFQLKGSGWYLTDYARKSQPSDSGTKKTVTSDTTGDKASSTKKTDKSDKASS